MKILLLTLLLATLVGCSEPYIYQVGDTCTIGEEQYTIVALFTSLGKATYGLKNAYSEYYIYGNDKAKVFCN